MSTSISTRCRARNVYACQFHRNGAFAEGAIRRAEEALAAGNIELYLSEKEDAADYTRKQEFEEMILKQRKSEIGTSQHVSSMDGVNFFEEEFKGLIRAAASYNVEVHVPGEIVKDVGDNGLDHYGRISLVGDEADVEAAEADFSNYLNDGGRS